MMTNLFSIFDPSSSLFGVGFNWLSMVVGVVLLPVVFLKAPSRWSNFSSVIPKQGRLEMTALLTKQTSVYSILFYSLCAFILYNNILGLLPCVFTATSHLVFTLSLALPLWLGFYTYGWVGHTTSMLAHLVPHGTPPLLMPLMVVIEGVSSLIRPGTLAIRLAANMIAGHLLLALLAGAASALSPHSVALVVLSQVPLLLLEGAVAMIQSYVFAILITLYTSEI